MRKNVEAELHGEGEFSKVKTACMPDAGPSLVAWPFARGMVQACFPSVYTEERALPFRSGKVWEPKSSLKSLEVRRISVFLNDHVFITSW